MNSKKKSTGLSLCLALVLGLSFGYPLTARASGGLAKAWAIITNANWRFIPYPGSSGALLYDRETGLVWTSSPIEAEPNTPGNTSLQYTVLSNRCRGLSVDVNGESVRGFRLPSVEELTNIARHAAAFNNVDTSDGTVYASSTFSLQIAPEGDNRWEGGSHIKPEYYGVRFFGDRPETLRCELYPRISDSTDGMLHCPPANVGGDFFDSLCVRGGGAAADYHMNEAFN